MRPTILFALPALLLAALLLAGVAHAEEWVKIDFDADLRTMLVNTDSVQHNGNQASLTELQVEGRTAATRGDEFHILVDRAFDCDAGTSTVTKVQVFPDLSSTGTILPIPKVTYSPRSGSIDAIEMNIACKGNVPQSSNIYPSVAAAVASAFGDAVKLPASDSNRTTKGMLGMGPPPQAGVGKAGQPRPAGAERPQTP